MTYTGSREKEKDIMYSTITNKHDYYHYWQKVISGEVAPDEDQSKMIAIVHQARDTGLFYNRDVIAYIKKHNDFIPEYAWGLQLERSAVENGIMGMEMYSATSYLREKKIREDNDLALQSISDGQYFGSLSVNGKRYNKCQVTSINGRTVNFTGLAGRYTVTFWTEASSVQGMIDKAVDKGWRK